MRPRSAREAPAARRNAAVAGGALVGLLLGAPAWFPPPALAAAVAVRGEARCWVGYRPPVAAPVVDPFRLPQGPYGPGNRGLEYGPAPGTPVGAIGPGEVVFAGPVATRSFVTVAHPDGLRSSYGPLAYVAVSRGDTVLTASGLGTAEGLLHLGVRRGPDYLDPAPLLAWRRRAVLVPDAAFAEALAGGAASVVRTSPVAGSCAPPG
jgi:murein DD-endopeptidase MepM/ murein hydrolase activator NlpD